MAILEVHGLVKYFKGRKVVDQVSFEVALGEVVGLLGPNGAGKTTSFRMATGQISPNDGQVIFNNQDVTQLPMYRRARLGMGYLAQETSVFRKLSVEQNVLAVLEAIPMHRTIGRKLSRRERLDMTDKVLNQFGLSHLRKNNAARLSGGEKRRLEIARCLVADPLLILLDEPFTGIDPPTIADIKEIIRSLREQNIGILITDHQAREILTVADRVYLIHQGKVFLKGTPGEVASNEQAIRTYLGHTAEGLNFGDGGTAASAAPAARARPSLRNYVEQDRLQTLVDHLRGEDVNLAAAASVELVRQGPVVIPYLVESLGWRDLEMRLRAHDVLQQVWPEVPLDPQAPESERLMQLAHIRSRLERRAS